MLLVEPGDDVDFLEAVTAILIGSLESRPARMSLIKIDNWFDYKWLGFVGKLQGALGYGNRRDLRVPPFHPRRVLSQSDFRFDEFKRAYVYSEERPLHLYQQSQANFSRRVSRVLGSQDARLIWYSSNSLSNGRGAFMVYDLREDALESWYAEICRNGSSWKIGRVYGVSLAQVEVYREIGRQRQAS